MLRKLRTVVIAGLIASGGLLLAQAPASAATPGGQEEMRADSCRYMGYYIRGNGNIVELWDCTGQ